VVGVELISPNVRAELSKREEVQVTIDTLASARDPEVKNPLVEFASSHDIMVCDVALCHVVPAPSTVMLSMPY
jgi:hypothetical protein